MSHNLPKLLSECETDPIPWSATVQRFEKLAEEVKELERLLKTEYEIFGPLLDHESPHIRQTLKALTADKHHLYNFVHQLTIEERVNLLHSIEDQVREQVNAKGGAASINELEKSVKEIEEVVVAVNEFEKRQQLIEEKENIAGPQQRIKEHQQRIEGPQQLIEDHQQLIEERKESKQRQELMQELMETIKSLKENESARDEHFTAKNESPSDEYFTAESSLTEEDYLTASDMSEEDLLRHINAISNFGFRRGMGAIGSVRSNLTGSSEMQAPRSQIRRPSERNLVRQSSMPARHDGRVPLRTLQRAASQNITLRRTPSKRIIKSPSFVTSSPHKQPRFSPRRHVRNEPAASLSNPLPAASMEQNLTAWSMRHSAEYVMKILLRQLRASILNRRYSSQRPNFNKFLT